ncbi:type 1 fimbrial protein [Citrobacter farmeri]|nr:type 1 fimbrial protein [Citrobacter farmeri]
MDMMKKINKKLLTAAIFATLLSANASAADGTINFVGKVTASACATLVGAGPTGGSMELPATVTLPNVTSSTLNEAVGTYAGHTRFSIYLEDCEATAGLDNVRAIFTTATPAAGDSHVMGNTAPGGAQDVAIAILKTDGTEIDLNSGPDTDDGEPLPVVSGPVTLNYQAAYRSLTTTVTAGDVTGTANYIISYF